MTVAPVVKAGTLRAEARIAEAVRLRVEGFTWPETARAMGLQVSHIRRLPELHPDKWAAELATVKGQQRDQFSKQAAQLAVEVLSVGMDALRTQQALMSGQLALDPMVDLDDKGRPWVEARVRESAAHSLLAMAMKLVGEERRLADELESIRAGMVSREEVARFAARVTEIVLSFVPPEDRDACRRELLTMAWAGGPAE